MQAQNGIGNQSSVYNQLQGVANGTGPNPAQAMLNQQTGQNVANQGALMASQRGASSNPALLARQAAQQGAATQQQAVGQGASLQANQSLNALNQLGGLATQQVGQQGAALAGLNQGTQNEQQNVLNSINAQNNANVSNQASINSANAGLANTVAQGQQATTGGLLSGAGALAGLAKGGEVKAPMRKMAEGGPVSGVGQWLTGYNQNNGNAGNAQSFAQSQAGGANSGSQELQGDISDAVGGFAPSKPATPMASSSMGSMGNMGGGLGDTMGSAGAGAMLAAKGGRVPALVSPGERYLSPKEVKEVARNKKDPMRAGEKIPGKPKVSGARNSYANDTVPKTLEEGGIVLPRSVTQGKNPGEAAKRFVMATMAKSALKRGK